MLPDRVSSPGPLTYELGALPIALRGPAHKQRNEVKMYNSKVWLKKSTKCASLSFSLSLSLSQMCKYFASFSNSNHFSLHLFYPLAVAFSYSLFFVFYTCCKINFQWRYLVAIFFSLTVTTHILHREKN